MSGGENIVLVNGIDALQNRGDAIQAHSRINAGRGKRQQFAVFLLVVLLKNQIPDFAVTVAIAPRPIHFGIAGIVSSAPVIKDFRVRPARAAFTDRPPPVVFFAKAKNPVVAQTDIAFPDFGRLFVLVIDRNPQNIGIDIEFGCEKFPAPHDGLALEIIAEREVAQHLEKRGVARSDADLFDVVGAAAFLATRQTRRRWLLFALEIRHERLHSGTCQKRGRIAGN